jgi:hypothetical protein
VRYKLYLYLRMARLTILSVYKPRKSRTKHIIIHCKLGDNTKDDHKCSLEIIAVIFPCFYKCKLQFYRNIHLHSLKQFDIRYYFTENWN